MTWPAAVNKFWRNMDALSESAPLEKKTGRRVNQIILLGAVALILNALFNHFVTDASKVNKTLKAGDGFPAFSFTAMNGGPVSEKSFAGKPTIYFFFANWCPCSHQSIQWIKQMQAENAKSGLLVLGVGIQDSSANLVQFAKAHKLEFPVVTENGQDLAREVGVEITPTTIFVDNGGVIRFVHVGKIERYDQALDGLNAILKTPTASMRINTQSGAA